MSFCFLAGREVDEGIGKSRWWKFVGNNIHLSLFRYGRSDLS